MTTLPGIWALTMRTPIGSIHADMTFTDSDGVLTGTAAGKAETVRLHDLHSEVTPHGEHVTWRQSITKPMRLNLDFDVVITGDTMQGHSRAGRLPKSTVTGTRHVP
ncbi:hypothetical protein ACWZHB_06910 [Nocardia sp. FBN12]|uniref:hypothetical protein n=1 Tax=Nocardia sp. FBN12 TaxID=3419766 RepID=UPI003CFE2DD4